jgi:hypothetical protein
VGEARDFATSILADLPLDGQFNLITTTSFDRPQDLFSPDAALPRSVGVRVAVVADVEAAKWRMRGAVTQGDLSSGTVAGDRTARRSCTPPTRIRPASYGMQRYAGGNAEALSAITDGQPHGWCAVRL